MYFAMVAGKLWHLVLTCLVITGEHVPTKVKIINQILAWSFSRISTYRQCPLKAKLANIDKIREPSSEPMLRGSAVHYMSEAWLIGRMPKLDSAQAKAIMQMWGKEITEAVAGKFPMKYLGTFRKEYLAIKKLPNLLVEQQWAFTDTWAQTGWFVMTGPELAWCRVKVDIHWYDAKTKTVYINDTKTGKNNKAEEHDEQLSLYALAAFLVYPKATSAVCTMQYVDQGENRTTTHQRSDLPKLQKLWQTNAAPLLNDRRFAPRPNRFCGWCFYRKDNKANGGGQCPHSGN